MQNYVYSFKYLRNIISLFLNACVGASSYFLNVLLLLAMFERVFCKDFPGESFSQFYNQIKCKRGKNFHLPAENNKPIEILQTKKPLKDCSAFERLKFLGGFQTLVMTEYTSGSLMFDMALYCVRYNRHNLDERLSSE